MRVRKRRRRARRPSSETVVRERPLDERRRSKAMARRRSATETPIEGSHFSDGTHSCFTSIRWRRPGSSSDSVAERWRVSVGAID